MLATKLKTVIIDYMNLWLRFLILEALHEKVFISDIICQFFNDGFCD